ncbi:MAG: amidohydrolase [Chloroflexi bacterium]|nr:amidohydrolase [Chloroflexota bacterium]MCL5074093.1 amidohydrolase [Chloroflexota bacterium]
MKSDILIKDCTVVTLSDDGVLEHTDVLIDKGLIVAIAPTGSLAVEADKTIEGRGSVLLPGLVNTHTHVGQSFHRGTSEAMRLQEWLEWGAPYITKMTPDDLYWAVLLSAAEMIKAGITTFADMFFNQEVIAEAIKVAGLRACLYEGIMETRPERGSTEAQFRRAVTFVERWNGRENGRIMAGLAPHSTYTCSFDTIREVVAASADLGIGLHTHLSETEREVAESIEKYGKRPPEVLLELGCLERPLLAAHCVHLSSQDIAILDRPNVGIAHNPGSNLKLFSGIAPIPQLLGRRLAVGLGSDGCGSNDTVDILKEMYLAAVIHPWEMGSSPAHSCLEMATIGGAKALGLGDVIGTVTVGQKADLILLDMEHVRLVPINNLVLNLVYTARCDDVATVIVDGRILMEDRRLKTLDEEQIIAECSSRAARVFGA